MAESAEASVKKAYQARRAGRADEALDCYRRAAAALDSESDALRFAHAVRHVADILVEMGRANEAQPEYERALGVYRNNLDTRVLDLANTLRGIALMHEDLGNLEGAFDAWREAKQLYASVSVEAGVKESAQHLDELCRRCADGTGQ